VVGYGTNRAGQPPSPFLIKEGNHPEYFHLSRVAHTTRFLRRMRVHPQCKENNRKYAFP